MPLRTAQRPNRSGRAAVSGETATPAGQSRRKPVEERMTLVRYRPWKSAAGWPAFADAPTRFSRMIEEMFDGETGQGFGWNPAVDIVENDGELLLTAELPGMKREDVHIEVNEGMLTLRGEKREHKEEKTGNARLVERTYGAFERSFTLPRSVDAEKIAAEFADGVLMIHMPKTAKAAGRKVEIATK
jgi:HSP20 family protein